MKKKEQNKIISHPAASVDNPELLTTFCKATADSLRLQILRLLSRDSLSVLEMARILDIRQSALSHHLKILASAGLVSTRREGNLIFYRRGLLFQEDLLCALKTTLFDTVDLMTLEPELADALDSVKREREQLSLDFFNKFADKFRQDEDLVADSRQYASCLTDLLEGLSLDDRTTALEVGPGEGKLLPLFSRDFSSIIALDKSPQALERSRQAMTARNISNVEYVNGDTRCAVSQGLVANLIIVSMVLHHTEQPLEIFRDLYNLTETNGAVLIIDLCRHSQQWLRETRGDLWLGFEPEELTQWAESTGFRAGQSLYLGLRNGFQIQMRLFHKEEKTIPGKEKPGDYGLLY